jgi:hypothetical protein
MALTKLNSNAIPYATGSIIQTVFVQKKDTGLTLTQTPNKWISASITTKAANSTFLIRVCCPLYSEDQTATNHDVDMAAALGYKIGSGSATSTDYTAISTYEPSRHSIPFASSANRAFYSQDGYHVAHSYATFAPYTLLYNEDSFAPNQAVGTVIDIGCFVVQDSGSAKLRINASSQGYADSGSTSSMTVQEIATGTIS